ncbi:MAG: HD domain-containing protein [Desulfatibacillaceae bacterium]|nr:HD domain-containing protein [Desulfatibacillaceae bacterium]
MTHPQKIDEPANAMNALEEEVRLAARPFFDGSAASHDWDHTLRVAALAKAIGQKEGADLLVVRLAAYLHDIGRSCQDKSAGAICHAQKGCELALPILANLPLDKGRKDNILHCIGSHRFRKGESPSTIEAKTLFDADKLDAIGAVGVARAFQFAGEVGARLHNPDIDPKDSLPYTRDDTGYREYCLKLSLIKNLMLTKEGARLARKRHAFMEAFFRRFMDEYRAVK